MVGFSWRCLSGQLSAGPSRWLPVSGTGRGPGGWLSPRHGPCAPGAGTGRLLPPPRRMSARRLRRCRARQAPPRPAGRHRKGHGNTASGSLPGALPSGRPRPARTRPDTATPSGSPRADAAARAASTALCGRSRMNRATGSTTMVSATASSSRPRSTVRERPPRVPSRPRRCPQIEKSYQSAASPRSIPNTSVTAPRSSGDVPSSASAVIRCPGTDHTIVVTRATFIGVQGASRLQ